MSSEESDPTSEQEVKLEDHPVAVQENNGSSNAIKDVPAVSVSKEADMQDKERERLDSEKERKFNDKLEVPPNTGSKNEKSLADEGTGITDELHLDAVHKEGEYNATKESRSNEESEAGENLEENLANKEKAEEGNNGTAPDSPSQAAHYKACEGQGYMHMYGHSMYSQYGFHHYQQPLYYTGGYHPHYPMPSPHVMPPQQYPQESDHNTISPGRRYHHMPPYYPYQPASPVLLPPSSGSQNRYPTYEPGPEFNNEEECKEGPEGDLVADNMDTGSSRTKIYVKQSGHASEEVIARRSRKNAQSRARAAKHRALVAVIEGKDPSERTPEEQQVLDTYQTRRKRKNDRSRERALEKKEEVDKILAKPEVSRSNIEKQFLGAAMSAKKRKNEGDRLRRGRLKDLGFGSKGLGKPGIPARGPMPSKYAAAMVHPEQVPPRHENPYGMPPTHGYPPIVLPPPSHGDTSPAGGTYEY